MKVKVIKNQYDSDYEEAVVNLSETHVLGLKLGHDVNFQVIKGRIVGIELNFGPSVNPPYEKDLALYGATIHMQTQHYG